MKDKTALQNYLLKIFPVILVLFSVFLSTKNYTQGTFLTGWDTLHPEFNFSIYWERILNGAWQDHQGLGTVATQAHSGEIPRVLLMQFLDVFFGLSDLRYIYMFLMLILGPLGVYFLLREVLEGDDLVVDAASFIGGLFYLLNLSTLQHFYVPLEMFPTHFGILGWLLLFLIRFLKGKKRALLIFAIISALSAPQAHTSTLFIAFFGSLLAILVLHVLLSWKKSPKTQIKKAFVVILVFILANFYWLGPNLYFIFTEAPVVAESRIHSLFSEEAILQNKQYGNPKDVSVLKGFLFNWGEHVGNGSYGDLLDEWKDHLGSTEATSIYAVFFVLSVLGVLIALLKRDRFVLPFLGSFLLAYFFIANSNVPFGFIYDFVKKLSPLFEEGFRFPFTKFSTILALSYAVFISYFFVQILSFIRSKSIRVTTILFVLFIGALSLVYSMKPAFNGNLISKSMRVSIPERYFEMFDYFDSQDDYGRVANLPIHSFWGWVYYDWEPVTRMGYQGAGFTWFGIKQPLLDREFDRWGSSNEQYYREMSYAVYSEDLELFESLLEKYKIKWVLLDESVFQPGSNSEILHLDEIKSLLEQSTEVSLAKSFGEGLYVYEVQRDYSKLTRLNKAPFVGDFLRKETYDPIYLDYGNYVVTEREDYPFVGEATQTESLREGFVNSTASSSSFNPKMGTASTKVHAVDLLLEENGLLRIKDLLGGSILSSGELRLVEGSVLNIKGTILGVEKSGKLMTTVLEEGEDVEVGVYSPGVLSGRYSSSFSVLEPCSVVGEQTAYTLTSVSDGFKLGARNVNACVTTPLEAVFIAPEKETMVLQISVDTEEFGAASDICLFNELTGGCIGTLSEKEGGLNLSAELDIGNIEYYYLRFFANSRDESETSVSYKNLTFQELVISDNLVLQNIEFPLTATVEKSLIFQKELILDSPSLKFLSSPHICGSGIRDLEEEYVSYTDTGVVYETDKEFLCDSFKLSTLSSDDGYLVEVRSRNLEGPSQRLCITNQESTRCDLYVSLPKSKDFVTSYYFLPPTGNVTYTLNLTSLAFGEVGNSKNEVSYVSFTPVPYKALKHLSTISNPVRKDVLQLSESYNKGWVALCGVTRCPAEHILVNNWANGWVFENADIPASVKIVFWPQFLQYFGYLLALGTLFFLIIPIKNKD